MRRFIALTLTLTLVLSAGSAAARLQGGVGDDGNPPTSLNPGDENAPGALAGAAFIELRDIVTTANGTPSAFGARFMRVTARIGDGEIYRFVVADFVCGDAVPAGMDPCETEESCTPGKGNKTKCEDVQVVSNRKQAAVQAVAVFVLIPPIVEALGLPLGTSLELTKLKKYVAAELFTDPDGVLSDGAILDFAFDIP